LTWIARSGNLLRGYSLRFFEFLFRRWIRCH
jgi:hypothetical protein